MKVHISRSIWSGQREPAEEGRTITNYKKYLVFDSGHLVGQFYGLILAANPSPHTAMIWRTNAQPNHPRINHGALARFC